MTWQNWGRTQACDPARVLRPTREHHVVTAVQTAAAQGLPVKALGAGHSFSAIALTTGVQLDTSGLTGLVAVDQARARVSLRAGTPLHAVPALLAPHNLAMTNLGDIDQQSIAGAISTGTHGTGLAFGGLATQVVAARFVDGTGQVHALEDDHPWLPALSLGLGALGVLTEVTLQCVPAFTLQAIERPEPLEAVLDNWPQRTREQDHFEFYWFPHTRRALTKTNTRRPAGAGTRPLPGWRRRLDDDLLSNGVFEITCRACARAPSLTTTVNRAAARLTGNRTFSDAAARVFTTRRAVRFREMEYAVPHDILPVAARALVGLIERRRWRISFPLEFRAAAADDRWLSTAYGRETAYLAVHRFWRDAPDDYFREVEALLRDHGGRPHWGKMHTRSAADLAADYPRFGDFLALRDTLDPLRVFANDYLDRVLGP